MFPCSHVWQLGRLLLRGLRRRRGEGAGEGEDGGGCEEEEGTWTATTKEEAACRHRSARQPTGIQHTQEEKCPTKVR